MVIYVDDNELEPGVEYKAELGDCCISGAVQLGMFLRREDYELHFENASFTDYGQVQFIEVK